MTLLEARHVQRHFQSGQQRLTALAPTSLILAAGDFLVITGPSGSGKSTLLNLLSGLDRPSEGVVLFRESPLNRLSAAAMAHLRNQCFGFIFQTPHVLMDKTVLENVALPLRYAPVDRRAASEVRCRSLLDYVGLADFAARRPNTLSGGELQRLVFARSLVNDPDIIFADEPTGSLDPRNSQRLLELLQQQVTDGRSVIMVTHDAGAVCYGNRRLQLEKAE